MKLYNLKIFVLLMGILLKLPAYAQVLPVWYSFTDAKSELTGYKDAQGKIKIQPRYSGLIRANIFKNIIAVTDNRTLKSYYLLKNGKQVGRDSIYVWDMTYDCEQERKIRFRDPKTDKVGFFGPDGKILIPAVYSDAQPFYNGLAVVLYNGKRVCADGTAMGPDNPCEHWYWDGITALIDQKGNLVADSLDINTLQHLNWYSLQTADNPADTTLRVSFKAKNGRYYSFVNYEKEFNRWFYNQYLAGSRQANFPGTFDMISVEGIFKNQIRKFFSKKAFQSTYHATLMKKLQRIKAGKIKTQILSEPLNDMIYAQPAFRAYYTDCGEADSQQYPLFDVITTVNNIHGKFLYQEHFSFLRTANGYKLIEVAWKNLQ